MMVQRRLLAACGVALITSCALSRSPVPRSASSRASGRCHGQKPVWM